MPNNTRITWDTPVNELYHSDTIRYIDLAEDEIMHWKYIKRVKLPGGGYRYYYDESELKKYEAEAKAAKAATSVTEAAVNTAKNAYNNAKNELTKAEQRKSEANGFFNKLSATTAYNLAKTGEAAAANALSSAKTSHQKASAKAAKAVSKYESAKVTSFVARTVSKGIVAVANLISGLFSKKTKPTHRTKSGKF